MSRRRILNITARKKQDNMIPTRSDADGSNAGNGGQTMVGNIRSTFIWCPTGRDKQSADPTAQSTRETDNCFIRGIKENITLVTNTSAAWRWRRIVFAVKGLPTLLQPLVVNAQGAQGYVRLIPNYSTVAATVGRNVIEGLVFRGNAGTDWQTVMTAKVDTQRVTLLSDRTRTLNSGNGNGRFFKHKQWYPVNKTLVYNNDETGETENTAEFSTLAKPGVGDIFILDFFDCASQNVVDQLFFEPEATVYWHEK